MEGPCKRSTPMPCCNTPELVGPRMCPHVLHWKESGLESLAIASRYVNRLRSDRLIRNAMCVFIACWKPENHIFEHFNSTGHSMGYIQKYDAVYCHSCGDVVHDDDCQRICERERYGAIVLKRSKKDPLQSVSLSSLDVSPIVREHSIPLTSPNHYLGLRGLTNLANTCFMNCIIQCLAHTPMLRDYFLSDKHPRSMCSIARSGVSVCMACSLDDVMSHMFSGDRTPFVPAQLLFCVWKLSSTLAGYEQQDAHEFLISVLNGLHTHVGGTANLCSCVVHTIFGGRLQSDVQCSVCHTVSTAYDPILDISLDIPKPSSAPESPQMTADASSHVDALRSSTPPVTATFEGADEPMPQLLSSSAHDTLMHSTGQRLLQPLPELTIANLLTTSSTSSLTNSSLSVTTEDVSSSASASDMLTLRQCLKRFTAPEMLGREEHIHCSRCKAYQPAVKQLAIDQLPLVACFHIKRFMQHRHSKYGKKINTYVRFPLQLNLREFVSVRHEEVTSDVSEVYALTSVVVHKGSMDNGHYISYVRRSGDEWVRCDDAVITLASLRDVLSCEAYLLFYTRQTLEYDDYGGV